MPTYDLVCKCGHAFELFRRKPIAGLQRCPKCKRRRAEIQFGGGAAAICKGPGFYSTDNRSDGYKVDTEMHHEMEKMSEKKSKAGLMKPNERRG